MCNTDERIERLAPLPSAPLECPSESRWATEKRARRSDAASRRRYVLKAGSAYYHDLDSRHNHWLQHEIVSEEESKVRCDRRLENVEAYRKKYPDIVTTMKMYVLHNVITEIDVFDVKGSSHTQKLPIPRSVVHGLLEGWKLDGVVINAFIGVMNLQIAHRKKKLFIMDTDHMCFLTDNGKFMSMLCNNTSSTGNHDYLKQIQTNMDKRNGHIAKWLAQYAFDLKSYDTLLIPIHARNGSHWELCVIDFRFKRIRMYDSKDDLHSEHEKYFHAVIALHWVSGLKELDATEWKWDIVSKLRGYDIPSQDDENDTDCGVLMLKYMESEALGRPLQRMGQMLAKNSDSMKRCREELVETLLS